jgi:hypothetical protein
MLSNYVEENISKEKVMKKRRKVPNQLKQK